MNYVKVGSYKENTGRTRQPGSRSLKKMSADSIMVKTKVRVPTLVKKKPTTLCQCLKKKN